MEHRHIPAAKDGSIPDAKTRFRRGQDIFLEDVWYGRCAICGELIRPPKLWYWYRNGLFLLPAAAYIPILIWLLNLAVRTDGPAYLAFVLLLLTFLSLFAISELIERAILTFGRWQEFPTGLKAKQLQFRSDRKKPKADFHLDWHFFVFLFCLFCADLLFPSLTTPYAPPRSRNFRQKERSTLR